MNLKEQTYVCTLAETGSLTQAAKLLFISQPALSLYISNLENCLGVRLFERIGKQFVLTYAGELYVEKARQMLKLKDTFDSELTELIQGQSERLRIGMQDIRSHFLAPSVLPEITEMFPKTKFEWIEQNYDPLEKMLLDNQIDICFCNCKTLKKDFEYIPLLNDEVVFLAPKNHPLTAYAEIRDSHRFPWIDLALFKDERFILTYETQSLRRYSNQILDSCNIRPKNIFLLKKIFITIGLVNRGFGVSFSLSGYINWSRDLQNVGLFSVVDPPVTATFYAMYKKGRVLTPAASALIGLIRNTIQKQVNDLYHLSYVYSTLP